MNSCCVSLSLRFFSSLEETQLSHSFQVARSRRSLMRPVRLASPRAELKQKPKSMARAAATDFSLCGLAVSVIDERAALSLFVASWLLPLPFLRRTTDPTKQKLLTVVLRLRSYQRVVRPTETPRLHALETQICISLSLSPASFEKMHTKQ